MRSEGGVRLRQRLEREVGQGTLVVPVFLMESLIKDRRASFYLGAPLPGRVVVVVVVVVAGWRAARRRRPARP